MASTLVRYGGKYIRVELPREGMSDVEVHAFARGQEALLAGAPQAPGLPRTLGDWRPSHPALRPEDIPSGLADVGPGE